MQRLIRGSKWLWARWSNQVIVRYFLCAPFSERPTAMDVYHCYRLFMRRKPDRTEWAYWLHRLHSFTLLELFESFSNNAGQPILSKWVVDSSISEPEMTSVVSQLVTQRQIESEVFRQWCAEIKHAPRHHRKLWEFAYILQALKEQNLLRPNVLGLGFGVGKEPLAALMAKYGCRVLATDLELESARKQGWRDTDQHANSLAELNENAICDPEAFQQLVSFRNVDMNNIAPDLLSAQFDFVWSACSLEHVGSIELGLQFIKNSLRCLKPGGIAIHTTEYNLSSNDDTLVDGPTVVFRRKDIEGLVAELQQSGYEIMFNPNPGNGPIDRYYDLPPYTGTYHLRLKLGQYVSTSVGLLIRKPETFVG